MTAVVVKRDDRPKAERQHYLSTGQPKRQLTEERAHIAAAEQTYLGVWCEPYRCAVCSWWHVGKQPKRRAELFRLYVELGPRAMHNLRRENHPLPDRRLAAIARRLRRRGREAVPSRA